MSQRFKYAQHLLCLINDRRQPLLPYYPDNLIHTHLEQILITDSSFDSLFDHLRRHSEPSNIRMLRERKPKKSGVQTPQFLDCIKDDTRVYTQMIDELLEANTDILTGQQYTHCHIHLFEQQQSFILIAILTRKLVVIDHIIARTHQTILRGWLITNKISIAGCSVSYEGKTTIFDARCIKSIDINGESSLFQITIPTMDEFQMLRAYGCDLAKISIYAGPDTQGLLHRVPSDWCEILEMELSDQNSFLENRNSGQIGEHILNCFTEWASVGREGRRSLQNKENTGIISNLGQLQNKLHFKSDQKYLLRETNIHQLTPIQELASENYQSSAKPLRSRRQDSLGMGKFTKNLLDKYGLLDGDDNLAQDADMSNVVEKCDNYDQFKEGVSSRMFRCVTDTTLASIDQTDNGSRILFDTNRQQLNFPQMDNRQHDNPFKRTVAQQSPSSNIKHIFNYIPESGMGCNTPRSQQTPFPSNIRSESIHNQFPNQQAIPPTAQWMQQNQQQYRCQEPQQFNQYQDAQNAMFQYNPQQSTPYQEQQQQYALLQQQQLQLLQWQQQQQQELQLFYQWQLYQQCNQQPQPIQPRPMPDQAVQQQSFPAFEVPPPRISNVDTEKSTERTGDILSSPKQPKKDLKSCSEQSFRRSIDHQELYYSDQKKSIDVMDVSQPKVATKRFSIRHLKLQSSINQSAKIKKLELHQIGGAVLQNLSDFTPLFGGVEPSDFRGYDLHHTQQITNAVLNELASLRKSRGVFVPKTFIQLYKDERYTDLLLKLHDQEIKTHKRVLMTASPYFKKILETVGQDHQTIRLPDSIDVETFPVVLRFMYLQDFVPQQWAIISLDDAAKVLHSAALFKMYRLAEETVAKVIIPRMSPSRLLDWVADCAHWQIQDTAYIADYLAAYLTKYFAHNSSAIISKLTSNKIHDFSPAVFSDLIAGALQRYQEPTVTQNLLQCLLTCLKVNNLAELSCESARHCEGLNGGFQYIDTSSIGHEFYYNGCQHTPFMLPKRTQELLMKRRESEPGPGAYVKPTTKANYELVLDFTAVSRSPINTYIISEAFNQDLTCWRVLLDVDAEGQVSIILQEQGPLASNVKYINLAENIATVPERCQTPLVSAKITCEVSCSNTMLVARTFFCTFPTRSIHAPGLIRCFNITDVGTLSVRLWIVQNYIHAATLSQLASHNDLELLSREDLVALLHLKQKVITSATQSKGELIQQLKPVQNQSKKRAPPRVDPTCSKIKQVVYRPPQGRLQRLQEPAIKEEQAFGCCLV